MKKLEDLNMKELRALAADVEPLVDRPLKATSKDELAGLIDDALTELDEEQLDAILVGHGLAESSVSDSTGDVPDSAEDPDEDEGDVNPDESDPVSDEPSEPEAPTQPAKGEKPYAIQIREHPTSLAYTYGDIIINPPQKMVDSVAHVPLSKRGVEVLRAKGYRTRKLSDE